jgi:hypothetical protein
MGMIAATRNQAGQASTLGQGAIIRAIFCVAWLCCAELACVSLYCGSSPLSCEWEWGCEWSCEVM